jgi:diacylglycerol kinase family enzyme
MVAEQLHEYVKRVYVFGGDGTASEVASALVATDIPLAIIPAGTTNILARECGIPRRPLRATEILVRSDMCRQFDTWVVTGERLVLALGVGFDARLMHNTSPLAKRRWGLAAVYFTAMREFLTYTFPPISIEGEDHEGRLFQDNGSFVITSNTQRYTGDTVMFPQADPTDGLLDLIVFTGNRRVSLVTFWLLSGLPGRFHLKLKGVTIRQVRRVSIDASKKIEVHLNGNPSGYTPVSLEPSEKVSIVIPDH